jgi:hypothetical protein
MKRLLMPLLFLCHVLLASAHAELFGSRPSPTPTPQVGAVSQRHELLLNFSDYGLNQVSFGGGAALGFGGGYNYKLIPLLQLGVRAGVIYKSINEDTGKLNPAVGPSVSSTAFLFLVGATLNFPTNWNFNNEFFGGLYVGVKHRSVLNASTTPFTFNIELGKRFALFPHFNFRPMFTLSIPTNGLPVVASFQVLSVSLVF